MDQYKFCPKCGGDLKKESQNLLHCQRCDFKFYLSPKPASSAILLNNQGEIMLVKRALAPKKGYWDLPGGFTNLNETSKEALVRELQEELGITLNNFQYLSSYTDRYLYQGINYHLLVDVYIGQIESEEIKVADDIADFQFFPRDNLPFLKMAFKSSKQPLLDYLGLKNNGKN